MRIKPRFYTSHNCHCHQDRKIKAKKDRVPTIITSFQVECACVCVCMCVCVCACARARCCSVTSDSWQPHRLQPASSSVRGILQARILEWVAISSSRGSSRPRDRTRASCVSCIGRQILYHRATWEAPFQVLSSSNIFSTLYLW